MDKGRLSCVRGGRARKAAVVCCGAVIYALLYALCSQVDETGFCDLSEAGKRFLLAFPVALAVLAVLLRFAVPVFDVQAEPERAKKPFCTPGAFVLIFCCYVPMFLIEYPGSFAYDTQRQVYQILLNEYDAFHPLLHTLLIRFCLSMYGTFESIEKCAALYSLIQMTLLSGCFALLCASLSRTCGRRAARVAAVFFCLYPAHMAFASNCTKDVLFSGFFALFLAYSLEAMSAGLLTRRRMALWVLSGVLACLLRNNMIYAMIVWLAVVLIVMLAGGKRLRRLAMCAALTIVLSGGGNAALMALTDAANGNVREMLSVPVQQLARAYVYERDSFTDEELERMDEIFNYGAYTLYTPTLSDPVKNEMNDTFLSERMPEFWQLWFSVGKKCPEVYLDAFLNLALPSLYPYRSYQVVAPYIEVGLQNGVLTAPFALPDMVQPARFAGLRAWLYENIYERGADGIPVLRWLLNTGVVFWTLLMFWLYAMYAGDGYRTLVLLLAVLLWGTFLLGPVMQGRYLYPFICVLPLFVARPCRRESRER